MPWWGWIVIGAIMLGAELAFIDAQFYLVFLGSAALLVGFLGLAGIALADWAQWLIFGLLSIATLVAFRGRLYGKLRANLPPMDSGPEGDVVVTPSILQPGETCRVEYRGSTWTAHNSGHLAIEPGAPAKIIGVDGLTLKIRKAH